MSARNLSIVGLCRFSYLGFGDWRTHGAHRRGRSDEEILADNARMLFDEGRLTKRFSTFEALTLPSLAAQTDSDFKLIVLTSEDLPKGAAAHLRDLADRFPFLVPVFKPPGTASSVANDVYKELGYDIASMLQFRIDDDDALTRHYVARMRQFSTMLHTNDPKRSFSITFPTTLGVLDVKGKIVFKSRHFPNTGAGQAIYHPTRNVLNWIHHRIDRAVLTLSDSDMWVLVTSLTGTNDSGNIDDKILVQRGYQDIDAKKLDQVMADHFPFITRESPVWETIRAVAAEPASV